MFSSKGLLQKPHLIFLQPNLEAGQLPSSPLQLTGTELSIADARSQERHFQESGHRPVPRRLLLFGRVLIGDFGLCILNPWNVRHTIAKNQTSHYCKVDTKVSFNDFPHGIRYVVFSEPWTPLGAAHLRRLCRFWSTWIHLVWSFSSFATSQTHWQEKIHVQSTNLHISP